MNSRKLSVFHLPLLLVLAWIAETSVVVADEESKPGLRRSLAERSPLVTDDSPAKMRAPIPLVLLAGAQKAGTTAISYYLANEKNNTDRDFRFCMSTHGKETHYFDGFFEQGVKSYQQKFAHCGDNSNLIDATPNTMPFPKRVRQTYQQLGLAKDVKIIFSLREPVSREIAWYHHRQRYDASWKVWGELHIYDDEGNRLTFEETLERDVYAEFRKQKRSRNYLNLRGLYAEMLSEWFRAFNRKQILVLSYDELKTDPTSYMTRIFKFLKLPIPEKIELEQLNVHPWSSDPVSCDTQDKLAKMFVGPNEALYKLLEENPGPEMEQRPFPKFNYTCKEK